MKLKILLAQLTKEYKDDTKNNGISLITIPYYGKVNSMLAKELTPLIEKKVDNK